VAFLVSLEEAAATAMGISIMLKITLAGGAPLGILLQMLGTTSFTTAMAMQTDTASISEMDILSVASGIDREWKGESEKLKFKS
jgi:hypothetical protein